MWKRSAPWSRPRPRSVLGRRCFGPAWLDEFVTVITNPLYLTLTVALGIPLAALWYLNMLGLVQAIGQKVYDQGLQLGLAQLRQHFDGEPVPVLAGGGGGISRNSTSSEDRQESETMHHRPHHGSSTQKDVFEMRSFKEDKKNL